MPDTVPHRPHAPVRTNAPAGPLTGPAIRALREPGIAAWGLPVGMVALAALAAMIVTACDGAASAGPPISQASVARPTVERTLTARGIELRPPALAAPRGTDVLIAFDNADPGVPHGLALYGDAAHTIVLGTASIVVGPDHQVVRIAGLAAGRYQFSCVVHPMMVADLVVAP